MIPETEPYVVQRGRRVETVAISADRRRSSSAPRPRRRSAGWTIVRDRALAERLRRFRGLPPAPRARESVSGETFLYVGRQAWLLVEPGVESEKVRLTSGRLGYRSPRTSLAATGPRR